MAALLLAVSSAGAAPLRFFAVGDLPYSDWEAGELARLLDDATAESPPFILHVGDIKGGSQPCTDARLREVAQLFRAQQVPLVYTPGDNEWTDCHRQRAGGYDPLERLAALRQVFFADPAVLRTAALEPVAPDPAYPENLYFLRGGVLFAVVHVVGSNNNIGARSAAAQAELRARTAANRALLAQATAAAKDADAAALVLIFHANPLFEERGPRRGFVPVKQDIHRLLAEFAGPVLLIHGDTHGFRFDRPLKDSGGRPISRFQRLEVPGSPTVAGVWVTVDPDATPAFSAEQLRPSAYGSLMPD